MDLVSSIVALLSFFLLLLVINYTKHNSKKSPPMAGGAWPIVGHLHLMGDGNPAKLPHFNLGALADKYGPAYTIRLGVHKALVVSSWDLAKELFTTNDVNISSRPLVRATKHLGYKLAMFGFTPYSPYWRQMRKLVNMELLSMRRVELLNSVRVSELNFTINGLYKLWKEKKDASGKISIEMKQCVGEMNLNIILGVVAGKKIYGNAEETTRCRRIMRDLFHLSGVFVAADALPYLAWFDIGGFEKKMKNCARELNDLVGGWLDEHKQNQQRKDKPRDFMDLMLELVKGPEFQGQYNVDTIIKATCEALIAGGTDTTTIMIVWALALMLNNPHVLEKAQEELDQVVGRERRVNETDINKLVYLQAIAKETLRLYPAGPLGGAREFSKDCNIGGYHIPKGTWLIVNLWKLQRDPTIWADPHEFKPERFLNEHKNLDVKGQDFELIPFGAGRRICPGTNFGLQMLHLGLAFFLQAFEFSTLGNEKVDMTESAGLTNTKVLPLDVLISPRLAPTLY